jgi:hypothetical protein
MREWIYVSCGFIVPVKLDFEEFVRRDDRWCSFACDAKVKVLHKHGGDGFKVRGLGAGWDMRHVEEIFEYFSI